MLTVHLKKQRSPHEHKQIEALAAYCGYGYLTRFEVLNEATRKLLYESIVAFCRAKVGTCASDRLRAHRSTIIRSLRNCKGNIYVYGLAKTHAPKSETWERDTKNNLRMLQNLLNGVGLARQAANPKRLSSHLHAPTNGSKPSRPNLLAILQTLDADYPHRLVVLPTAFASAKDAADFRSPEQAGLLMRRLVDDYLPLREKYGDEYARRVFTDNQFAAKESKTTRQNTRALRTHTFSYNGQQRLFWKHLRIGNGGSSRDCWRCYFHHDQKNHKIVIAHCGAHLDLR